MLRKIIELVEQSEDIQEVEISNWWTRIKIARRPHGSPSALPVSSPTVSESQTQVSAPVAAEEVPEAVANAEPDSPSTTNHLTAITSPMVGTFYRAPAPGAELYVKENDIVKAGQVVCIIEAMKLMNEIESEVSGRIVRVLVDDAQPVEYGQKLFWVEPV